MELLGFDGFQVRIDLDRWPAKILRALLRRHYEKHELRLVRRLIKPGDRIVELGCAIGVVSLAAGKLTDGAGIVGFDANPEMVQQASANFALNGSKATAVHAALIPDSTGPAELSFNASAYFLGSSMLDRRSDAETIAVPTRPLDDTLRETRANVLIVDIEGAEVGLLDATDLGGIEMLVLEMHVSMLGTDACLDLVASLADQDLVLDTAGTAYNVLVFRRSAETGRGRRVTTPFARSYLCAIAHWEAGQSDAADRELRTASETCPDNSFAHLLRSQIGASGGRADDAVLDEAEKAAQLDPENEDAFEHLAEVHARRGELEPARAALASAIAISPCRPLFHAGLGTVLAQLGREHEALGAFRAAADLCPERATSLDFIRALANRMDKHPGDTSSVHHTEVADENRFLAALAAETGRFRLRLAGLSLSHALELAPGDHSLAYGLAALLATPKNVRNALKNSP